MKQFGKFHKALSVALIFCMLLGTALMTVLPVNAAAPAGQTTQATTEAGLPMWTNDETVGWRTGNWYGSDSPFKYEYYVGPGMAPAEDSRIPPDVSKTMGFYPMIWPTEGLYKNTRYVASQIDSNKGAKYTTAYEEACAQIGVMGGYFHVAPAVSFLAPYTGTVKFTYQCATHMGTKDGVKFELFISDENLNVDNGNTYEQKIAVKRAASEADFATKYTVELNVTAGEKVYFTMKNQSSELVSSLFYINSAEYTDVKTVIQSAKVIGHNIAALDTPVVRFYVKLPADAVGNSAEIKIGNDDAITVHGTPAVGIKGPDGNELTEEDHVLIYSIPVSAKRMTETITISIKNPSGTELLTEKNTYSVSEYCTAQVKDYKDAKAAGTDTAEQLALAKICTQILAYGRSAQKYFGYNTANLPVIDADVYALLAADMAD